MSDPILVVDILPVAQLKNISIEGVHGAALMDALEIPCGERRRRFVLGRGLFARFRLRNVMVLALIEAGWIKPDEAVGGSRKYARYLPFWA